MNSVCNIKHEKNNLEYLKKVVKISEHFNSKLIHISSTSVYGLSNTVKGFAK